MAVHFAICARAFAGCSRQSDETYVNVVIDVKKNNPTPRMIQDAAAAQLEPDEFYWDFLTIEHGQFSDPGSNLFVVRLTEQEYTALAGELFHDGHPNLPRYQQQTATSGAPKAFGSFATPQSAGSAFTLGTLLPDDRLIVRIYKAVPPGGANDHIAAEDLDEGQDGGVVTRWLRLFTPADAVLGGTVANQVNVKRVIAGRNMIFDFGSQAVPPLPAACTTFGVPTSEAGEVVFASNQEYRVVGPNGEKSCRWTVYGRVLRAL